MDNNLSCVIILLDFNSLQNISRWIEIFKHFMLWIHQTKKLMHGREMTAAPAINFLNSKKRHG